MSWGVSYTFSKVLDAADTFGTAVDPFMSPRRWNYGPAGFDRSHVFTARYNAALPRWARRARFAPVRWMADGWEISGITRLISGAPLTPTYSLVNGIDFTGSGQVGTRPYVVNPDAPVEERFGPPVWDAPNLPTRGNVGRGVLRGPGVNNWDVSIYKNFVWRERVRGSVRFETYNTLNHTQFSGVDASLNFRAQSTASTILNRVYDQINPLFMQPTSARPPRRAQLAIRLTF